MLNVDGLKVIGTLRHRLRHSLIFKMKIFEKLNVVLQTGEHRTSRERGCPEVGRQNDLRQERSYPSVLLVWPHRCQHAPEGCVQGT